MKVAPTSSGSSSRDDERKRLWYAHCHRMAEATYALADWCDEPEMTSAYLSLGDRWAQRAEAPPPSTPS